MKIKTTIRELLKHKLNFSIVKDDRVFNVNKNYKGVFDICTPFYNNDSLLQNNNNIATSIPMSALSYDNFLNIFNINDEYDFTIITPDITNDTIVTVTKEDMNSNTIKLFSNENICIYKGELLEETELVEKFETINLSQLICSNISSRNRILIKLVEDGKIKDKKLIDFINLIKK